MCADRPSRRHRPPEWVVALVAFVALTVVLFGKAWASPSTSWIGDPGDPPLFMWYLRWFPWAVAHGHHPLFTTHINFPDGVNLMWNTSMPLAMFVLSPVTMTLGPVFTYNVLLTLAVALSAWCCYLVLRRYVASRVAAAAGALLYGYSPYVLAHAHSHPNLPMVFTPPLLLLLLDEIVVRQRRSPVELGLALGAVTAAQLLLTEEVLATEAVVAALAVAVLAALHPRQVRARAGYVLRAVGVGLAVCLVVGAVPLAVQFLGPGRVRSGALWGPEHFVSDLLGFVLPRGQLLTPAWAERITVRFTDNCCAAEWNSYMGAPLIVFLAARVPRLWSLALVRVATVVAVGVAVLSMGPHLHVGGRVTGVPLPFAALARLPVLSNILAARLMVHVFLLAALLLALVLDAALRERGAPALLAGLAGVIVLAPLVPRLPFPSTPAQVPAFFTSAALHGIPEGSVALVAPFSRDTSTSGPMLWQAVGHMRYRMVSGYTIGPDRTGRFSYLPVPTALSVTMQQVQNGSAAPTLDPSSRAALTAELRAKRVDSVLVGPMPNQEAMVELFRSLLGREPERSGGVLLWREVRRL